MSTYSAPSASAAPLKTVTSCPSASETLRAPAFAAVLHRRLDEVATLWRAFEAEGTCTAYQCFDWARAIVTQIMPHRSAEPLIVEVADRVSGQGVMLLPFALTRLKTHTVITWLDLGVCDYAAPLLGPGFTPSASQMEEAWAVAMAALPQADLLRIDRIPETIGARDNPLAWLSQTRPMALQAFGTPIDGPPETLLKRICSSSTHKTFRRGQRHMEAGGAVRFVVATTVADARAIFDALLDQRRQRFRDIGRFDLLDRPEIRDFYRRSVDEGFTGGPARLFGLAVGDRWAATALGLVHGGTFHGILLAMDDAWRKGSPGLRIAADIMVWARRQGMNEFDLTIGDLPYKADLGASPRRLHEISIARTWRGSLVITSARVAADTKAWLQARPQWFEPLRRLRQAIRRRVGV